MSRSPARRRFCVNVLGLGNHDVAETLHARRIGAGAIFAVGEWEEMNGVPVLANRAIKPRLPDRLPP